MDYRHDHDQQHDTVVQEFDNRHTLTQ